MNYTVEQGGFEPQWNDEISCMRWLPNKHAQTSQLSKQKILRYFSELETLNPIHILLLDNMSKIYCLHYYPEDSEFRIFIGPGNFIITKIAEDDFENILKNSISIPF